LIIVFSFVDELHELAYACADRGAGLRREVCIVFLDAHEISELGCLARARLRLQLRRLPFEVRHHHADEVLALVVDVMEAATVDNSVYRSTLYVLLRLHHIVAGVLTVGAEDTARVLLKVAKTLAAFLHEFLRNLADATRAREAIDARAVERHLDELGHRAHRGVVLHLQRRRLGAEGLRCVVAHPFSDR
jgi:hypothetical protein